MVHDSHSHHRVQKHTGERDSHPNIDHFAYLMGVLGPVMTLSQSYLIWSTKSAANLSILAWLTYLVMAAAWFTYGVVHKERLMIFSNALWLLAHASVVVGIILYR